jgi:MazG family protein
MDPRLTALERLVTIVDTLRGPGGCPWDRAQKLGNMARYIEEEASEVVDAIEDSAGAPATSVCEELGDLLMNVVLAARIAADEGGFTLGEVAERIADKLVRRHPHVFGSGSAATVDDVLANWNAIKAAERSSLAASPPSRLDGVPRSLPALERAYELGKKAAKAGFDWPDAAGALEKVREEAREVEEALHAGPQRLEAELGDLLLAVVNLCRKCDIRPSPALRRTIERFRQRFHHIERQHPNMENVPLPELESAWQAAKSAAAPREETDR